MKVLRGTLTWHPAWFNTTSTIKHVTAIPEGIEASKAIALLQANEFYMKCDPHMVNYEPIDTPKEKPIISASRGVKATSEPKCYKVTDRVATLPAGIWDSDINSTYEFLNVERGVFVRVRSPLGVVMETLWTVEETKTGSLELVEELIMSCSRLLAGTIAKTSEASWEQIHQSMINKLKEGGTI